MHQKSDPSFVQFLRSQEGIAVPIVNSPGTLLENCHGCKRSLPWPLPVAGQWASPVSCPECGRWYFTQTRNHCAPVLKVDPDLLLNENLKNAPQKPQPKVSLKVAEIIARIFGECFVHEERRATVRYALSLPIVAVPLGEDGHPTAEAHGITILNLSAGGCLLLDDPRPAAPLLVLDFTATGCIGTQLLARVLRRETSGSGVKLGCAFLHGVNEALPFEG